MEDLIIMLMSFGMKLSSVVIALCSVPVTFLLLRHLDKRAEFCFKKWIAKANDDAVSRYLSARVIAVYLSIAIMVGLAIS